ncbi:transcriptional regulator PadR-like family protein [bacterium BMS3Abin02]|nr:transcriptional regulator PadR-like family protein [bacterium BMS3Abin02]GBE21660.1 transcriptional regulator PadR-like family protein [bacterium BMS3Bbin01]HDH26002.1 PadR family transcriptional regulator [Actinomycetota bacterium]
MRRGPHHGHPGHGHGPGPRGGRLLDAGLLLLISRGTSHGYPLIEAIREDLGLDVPDVGAVYRALRRQESQGLLTSTWETGATRPRRVYTITPAGREVLEIWMRGVEEMREALERLLQVWKGDTQ